MDWNNEKEKTKNTAQYRKQKIDEIVGYCVGYQCKLVGLSTRQMLKSSEQKRHFYEIFF